MYKFPIGVMLESFHKPAAEAMDAARALGAQGLQVYATPTALEQKGITTPAAQKEFFKMVKDHGLVISALCGDLGHGFGNPDLNPDLVEKSKRILDLAMEFETNIVTTHIGVVPSDPSHPALQDHAGRVRRAGRLCRHPERALRHRDRPRDLPLVLKGFLDSLHSTGVAVNLDPANLVMVTGDDPVQGRA